MWLARECCKVISQSHLHQIQASGQQSSGEQNETRALIEELVVDKEGLHARIEALDRAMRTYDIKGQSIKELFLRLEEETVSWEECVKASELKYFLF